MIREFLPKDGPAVVGLLTTQFPEEEALIGSRPERFTKVMERVNRWHMRLLFLLFRAVGKRLFQFLVAEEDGRLAGTTLLTFPGRSVYISMVVVDPTLRRRGIARALLERSRSIAQRMHRKFLVLDVLAANTPARTLYEQRLGYRPLRETAYLAHDQPSSVGPERTNLPNGLRRYRSSDSAPLLAIARQQIPALVQEVVPLPPRLNAGERTARRVMDTEMAGWVVDRGSGAEAAVFASSTPDAEACHFSDPIVSATADPALVGELFRTALAWAGARGRKRALVSVPRYNQTGRAALEREGFHDALSIWTLYRPVE